MPNTKFSAIPLLCLLLLLSPTAGAADGSGEGSFSARLEEPGVRESFSARVEEPGVRESFTARLDEPGVRESFSAGSRWLPFPDYSDREGWDKLFGPAAGEAVRDGENYLDYQWENIPATAYLAFERDGDRLAMESIESRNRVALISLILAELAEGQGRFIDQIANGVWFCCQQFSWVLSAHQVRQESGRALPDDREHFIDLYSGRRGAILSVAHYFFREQFDAIDPSISAAIRAAVCRQILDPYFDESENYAQWWLGFGDRTGLPGLNNWNPWCNSDCMLCFLLMEEDRDRLERAIERSARSVDLYMERVSPDGACDEGVSYWNLGFGKLYEWLQILHDASGGKFDAFDDGRLRRMGEFVSRSYIGGGWAVNFADAGAHFTIPTSLVWNYGTAVDSDEMRRFALYGLAEKSFTAKGKLSGNDKEKPSEEKLSGKDKEETSEGKGPDEDCFVCPKIFSGDIWRALGALRCAPQLRSEADSLNLAVRSSSLEDVLHDLRRDVPAGTWYDQTQVCYMRNSAGWFLAAKGGHNSENHNHNDVGSCVLFIRDVPVLVDAGVGVYTARTFGAGRYGLWTMQSDWHNLPAPSGMSQLPGRPYRAKDVSCDRDRGRFCLDISGAYLENSLCTKWVRTYDLSPALSAPLAGSAEASLTITDTFELSGRTEADVEHFLVQGEVILPGEAFGGRTVREGELLIVCDGVTVRMTYPKTLTASVEEIVLDDRKLESSWGPTLRRISLTSSESAPLSGTYTIRLTEM